MVGPDQMKSGSSIDLHGDALARVCQFDLLEDPRMYPMLTKLRRALRRHPLREFPTLILKNLRHYLAKLRDGQETSEVSEFDKRYGTDTSGIREISSLKIDSPNEPYAERYQASGKSQFHSALQLLAVDFSRFTYIDFGSGKGRTLLLASHYPFAKVLGVEFSPELHQIALTNIAKYRDDRLVCTDRQSILSDATKFQIPSSPLVCYFYNPFGMQVMRDVVRGIEDSMRAHPREIYAVYAEPLHRLIFKNSDQWELIHEDSALVIYRGRPTA